MLRGDKSKRYYKTDLSAIKGEHYKRFSICSVCIAHATRTILQFLPKVKKIIKLHTGNKSIKNFGKYFGFFYTI